MSKYDLKELYDFNMKRYTVESQMARNQMMVGVDSDMAKIRQERADMHKATAEQLHRLIGLEK